MVGVLTVLITGGVLYFYGEEIVLQPDVKPLKDCNILYDNGGPINIVFLADGEIAKKYADYLLSVYPFSRNKESFNFYYIVSDVVEEECKTYKGIALLCYSKNIVKEASACPADYIVILKEMPSSIRSSAFMNVMSLNTEHSLSVFAHEFGHAFANFAEEYITNVKIPRGSLNCQEKCEGFGGIENGCYPECTDSNHVRSIYGGVMRTLNSNEYGTFNEYLIKERIVQEESGGESLITGNVAGEIYSDCAEQQYLLIELYYKTDNNRDMVKVVSQSVQNGCAGSSGFGSVAFEYTEKETIKGEFNPLYIFTTNGEPGVLNAPTYSNMEQDGIPIVLKMPLVSREKGTLVLERVVEAPDVITPPNEEVKTEIRRVEVPLKSVEFTTGDTRGSLLLRNTKEAILDILNSIYGAGSQGETQGIGSVTPSPEEGDEIQSAQATSTYYSENVESVLGGSESGGSSIGNDSSGSATDKTSETSGYAIFESLAKNSAWNIVSLILAGAAIGLVIVLKIFKEKFSRKKLKNRKR